MATLVGRKRNLTVHFICIFLMTNSVEHLFMYLLAIWISSLEISLFKPFVHFFTRLSFCCQVVRVLYRYWIRDPLSDIWFAIILSHHFGYIFPFLIVPFDPQGFLISLMSSLSIFLLLLRLMISYVRILCQIRSQENLQLFFPKTFMILGLIFRMLIYSDIYDVT